LKEKTLIAISASALLLAVFLFFRISTAKYDFSRTVRESHKTTEGYDQLFIDRVNRFEQVLVNLVSNALKFTKVGSVRVLVERGIGEVSILVVDTGIGVSRETQAHLFQKFVQAEGGHAREYGGTGLGLVICKHLMEMMNGTVQLSSEGEGKGTTLTISMPIS